MNDYSKLNKVSLEIRNQVEEREHFHQDIELIYVLDGAMTVEVGNQKSELKAEDILVINANKKHWLRTNDKDILYLRLELHISLSAMCFKVWILFSGVILPKKMIKDMKRSESFERIIGTISKRGTDRSQFWIYFFVL